MSDVQEEARRQLDALRQDFEARLGSFIDEIARAWDAASEASDQAAAMTTLTDLVHRLAGNAGFFGLREVSRDATELEQALDMWATHTAPDEGIRELSPLLRALQAHAAR